MTSVSSPTSTCSFDEFQECSQLYGKLSFERNFHKMKVWRYRGLQLANAFVGLVALAVIYLTSELLIWGLSLALLPVKLQFFSSIVGMLLVFGLAVITCALSKETDALHHSWLKPKVDFINSHVGVAFSIPIVMLDASDVLNANQIARVIGTFVVTNVVAWFFVFGFAYAILFAWDSAMQSQLAPPQVVRADSPKPSDASYTTESTLNDAARNTNHSATRWWKPCSIWNTVCQFWPLWASLLLIFSIGIPIAVVTHDHRILDGSTLWFIWMGSVNIQRHLKKTATLSQRPRLVGVLATIANPVLLTTMLMTAYTRLKAAAMNNPHAFAHVHNMFSSGTPLYSLWTAAVKHRTLPQNPNLWFGAGDAALSILECGIVIWGFKLYECRRQLFSAAGFFTTIICIAMAVGNVFLAVLAGHALGLGSSEALAFAARNTTLALAKPAMAALGGNMVVNAAVVVSNGILGQLLYPYVLPKLNIQTETPPSQHEKQDADEEQRDGPITIAVGIAIGINGLAMGVSYLYETRSRAAPYAALAMTVYGVMTVVLTTVDPFKAAVIALAH